MKVISESDTVITTTDGRARLNVERLFNKPHVQQSLKEMRDKIRHARQEARLPASGTAPAKRS
jgi:hypothetical protein